MLWWSVVNSEVGHRGDIVPSAEGTATRGGQHRAHAGGRLRPPAPHGWLGDRALGESRNVAVYLAALHEDGASRATAGRTRPFGGRGARRLRGAWRAGAPQWVDSR